MFRANSPLAAGTRPRRILASPASNAEGAPSTPDPERPMTALSIAAGLAVAAVLAAMQLRLAADRDPARCTRAFVDNHRLGLAVFAGCALDFALGGA